MTVAVVALGSNMGERACLIREALRQLRAMGELRAVSGLYETAAWGPPQPDYLNAIALVDTSLDARACLDALLSIERRMGRVRGERWGPRIIDLDLVACGGEVIDTPELKLPHPEAHRRPFVLEPLVEVAPETMLPGYGVARELLAALSAPDRASVRPHRA